MKHLEKIRIKFMMIVSLSLSKSQEQTPATITLMIILSQRFDSISNKYFDKKFCGLERRLVEDAERNSHNVAKRGKQSKKHFSTRNGAAESSYRPLDLRGERQAPPRPNRHLHAASKVTGGSSAKWNLGLNNARVSTLQVEYNQMVLC